MLLKKDTSRLKLLRGRGKGEVRSVTRSRQVKKEYVTGPNSDLPTLLKAVGWAPEKKKNQGGGSGWLKTAERGRSKLSSPWRGPEEKTKNPRSLGTFTHTVGGGSVNVAGHLQGEQRDYWRH